MDELNIVYISGEPWGDFIIRLLVNIVSIFLLIRFVYYPHNNRLRYLFTFFLMGMMIFLIASILDRVSLDMGFALGLFAIFGIVRYRSPSIDLKEMTYLFLMIGVSIINALVEFRVQTLWGLFIANLIIIGSALIMERYKPRNHVLKRSLVFTPTNFSVLNSNHLLIEEIRNITGINVLRVEIAKINKTKNEVSVWIYFRDNEPGKLLEENVEPVEEKQTLDWQSTSSGDW